MDRGTGIGGDPSAGSRGYALSGRIMLTAIVGMFTTVLLILFLHLYLRWRFHRLSYQRRIRRSRRRRLVFAGEAAGAAPLTVASRGLDPAVLKSLPVIVFSSDAYDKAGSGVGDAEAMTECAVCLCEFEEGEKVRCLPRCGHSFHIECIDMWFHSHATCPLCRSTVEAADVAPPTPKAVDPEAPLAALQPTSSVTVCFPPEDLPSVGHTEEGMSSSTPPELRFEIPASGLSAEELGLGSKSPGSHKLLLRRILSGDLRLYRCGVASMTEPDLEQGEMLEQRPPQPTSSPPQPVVATSEFSYRSEARDADES